MGSEMCIRDSLLIGFHNMKSGVFPVQMPCCGHIRHQKLGELAPDDEGADAVRIFVSAVPNKSDT